jgi:hypothetical protein
MTTITNTLPPLPEPDGTAEANKVPHPSGIGYEYDEVPAWSEPLVVAYALAAVAQAEAKPAEPANPVTVYTNRGAAPAAPAPVTSGFVLVPVEPTPEMVLAAWGTPCEDADPADPGTIAAWGRMLAAAPAAPAHAEPVAEALRVVRHIRDLIGVGLVAESADWAILERSIKAAAAPAAPAEPVAWMDDKGRIYKHCTHETDRAHGFPLTTPLYAAPAAPAQSVTAADLYEQLALAHDASLDDDHRACRSILMEVMKQLDKAAPAPVPQPSPHCLWPSRGSCRAWQDKQAEAKPLTDEQIEAIGHRKAWRYKHSSDPAHSSTYTFNRVCLLDFARAAIAASKCAAPAASAQGAPDLCPSSGLWCAAPAAPAPLTLHQIQMLPITTAMGWVEITRVIEQAHGIGAASKGGGKP